MAITKTKRSVHKKQSAVRNQKSVKTPQNKQPKKSRNRPYPGELALQERTLPFRRFVAFPLVKGKVAEKVELFTSTDDHSLAIEFQDHTSLHLSIEPGFTIQAELMQMEKGNLETLAEWPPIQSKSLNDSN